MSDPQTYFTGEKKTELYKAYRRQLPDNFVKKIISLLSKTFIPSECAAVDVGCGSGQSVFPLAPYLGNIVGIDVSQDQLDHIDKSSIPKNVQFQLGSSDHLPFEDSSLQLVNIKSALHWLDIPKFFQEVDRVLKPGGVLAVSHGGGRFRIVGHEEEAEKLRHEILATDLPDKIKDKLKLVKNKYKDIAFPYDVIERDESYNDVCSETVSNVVRLFTVMGNFSKLLEEKPDEAKKRLEEIQEKLIKLVGVEGNPEETLIKIKYNYTLILCRKPL